MNENVQKVTKMNGRRGRDAREKAVIEEVNRKRFDSDERLRCAN
jgi:hypothetical protein